MSNNESLHIILIIKFEKTIDVPKTIFVRMKPGNKYNRMLPKPPQTIAVVVKSEIARLETTLIKEKSILYNTEIGKVKI